MKYSVFILPLIVLCLLSCANPVSESPGKSSDSIPVPIDLPHTYKENIADIGNINFSMLSSHHLRAYSDRETGNCVVIGEGTNGRTIEFYNASLETWKTYYPNGETTLLMPNLSYGYFEPVLLGQYLYLIYPKDTNENKDIGLTRLTLSTGTLEYFSVTTSGTVGCISATGLSNNRLYYVAKIGGFWHSGIINDPNSWTSPSALTGMPFDLYADMSINSLPSGKVLFLGGEKTKTSLSHAILDLSNNSWSNIFYSPSPPNGLWPKHLSTKEGVREITDKLISGTDLISNSDRYIYDYKESNDTFSFKSLSNYRSLTSDTWSSITLVTIPFKDGTSADVLFSNQAIANATSTKVRRYALKEKVYL